MAKFATIPLLYKMIELQSVYQLHISNPIAKERQFTGTERKWNVRLNISRVGTTIAEE